MSELETRKVPLRLVVWGESEAGVERAIRQAGYGPGRVDWEFVQVHPVVGGVNPIDPLDGATIAAEQGSGWAYAVYRVPGT